MSDEDLDYSRQSRQHNMVLERHERRLENLRREAGKLDNECKQRTKELLNDDEFRRKLASEVLKGYQGLGEIDGRDLLRFADGEGMIGFREKFDLDSGFNVETLRKRLWDRE